MRRARRHQRQGPDAGGTGTYDLNTWATEIQAGSSALMDTAYAEVGLPFVQAVSVLPPVISVSPNWAVADCGLKALGWTTAIPRSRVPRCGSAPTSTARSWPSSPLRVGARIRVLRGHADPTVADHEHLHLVDGDEVLERGDVDLRGW